MIEIKQIFKNNIILLIGTLTNRLTLFLLFIIIARKLGSIGFGEFYFLFSLVSIFSIFANFGMEILTVREIANNKNEINWYYPNVFLMKLFLSIISIGCIFIYLLIFDYPDEIIIAGTIAAVLVLLNTNMAHTESILRGMEKFKIVALIQIFHGMICLLIGIIVLNYTNNLIFVMIGFIMAYGIMAIISNLPIYLGMNIKLMNINFSRWKEILKMSYPFVLTSGLAILYYRMDILLLSKLAGDESVAWYGAASRIIENYGLIPGIFVSSIFPMLSRKFQSEQVSLERIANLSLKYLIILSIPITIISVIDAKKIIILFYGDDYIKSVLPFQVLCIRAFSFFVTTLMGHLLFTANLQKLYMYFTLVVVIMNIILNIILIPLLGFLGPPITISITTIIATYLHVCYVKKYVCNIRLPKEWWKYLAAGIVTVTVLLFSLFNIFLDILLVLFSYCATLLILKAFDDFDISIFRNLVTIRNVQKVSHIK